MPRYHSSLPCQTYKVGQGHNLNNKHFLKFEETMKFAVEDLWIALTELIPLHPCESANTFSCLSPVIITMNVFTVGTKFESEGVELWPDGDLHKLDSPYKISPFEDLFQQPTYSGWRSQMKQLPHDDMIGVKARYLTGKGDQNWVYNSLRNLWRENKNLPQNSNSITAHSKIYWRS